MIIIIEGPDGSGKTTLARDMSWKLNVPIIHNTPPTPGVDWFKGYMQDIAEYNGGVIFDRSWISDFAYGPIYRPLVRLEESLHLYEALDNTVVANGGGIIIYCTSNIRTLWSRCKSRGEDMVKNKEDLEQICVNYERFFGNYKGKLPVIRHVT